MRTQALVVLPVCGLPALSPFGLFFHVPCLPPHPVTASRFNWSALLVLPIAFVFVSYLQHQKDLSDKALALGVVKDPKASRRSRRVFAFRS